MVHICENDTITGGLSGAEKNPRNKADLEPQTIIQRHSAAA